MIARENVGRCAEALASLADRDKASPISMQEAQL
jgi:hypothetical protein